MKWKSEEGFTLIELMIVVAIIIILVAIGTRMYRGYAKRAVKSALEGAATTCIKDIVSECSINPSNDNVTISNLDNCKNIEKMGPVTEITFNFTSNVKCADIVNGTGLANVTAKGKYGGKFWKVWCAANATYSECGNLEGPLSE